LIYNHLKQLSGFTNPQFDPKSVFLLMLKRSMLFVFTLKKFHGFALYKKSTQKILFGGLVNCYQTFFLTFFLNHTHQKINYAGSNLSNMITS
jgi:hypothetical protein